MQKQLNINIQLLAESINSRLPINAGDPSSLERITCGNSGKPKFRARLSSGQSVFVKIQPTPFTKAQATVLCEIDSQTKMGTPFNRIICFFNEPAQNIGVLVTEWLDPASCFANQFLSEKQKPLPFQELEKLGHALCRLHVTTSTAYDITNADLERLACQEARAAKLGLLDESAHMRISNARAYLKAHRTIAKSLLHGDLHPGNLFMTNEGIVAVDFENAYHGAVLRDLAILQAYTRNIPELFGAVKRGYLSELGKPSSELIELYHHTAALVELLFALRQAKWGKPHWWY